MVIVITAFGSIETAVEAMKKGAYDYLEKPFKLEELKHCVQRALSKAMPSPKTFTRKQLKKKYQFSQIIGNSPKMQEVFRMVERVANSDATILILGESGTGKELIARPSLQQPEAIRDVCSGQLQRLAGKLAGVRVVWPPEGFVHRRHQR